MLDGVSQVLTITDSGFENRSVGGSYVYNATGSGWAFTGDARITDHSALNVGIGYSGSQVALAKQRRRHLWRLLPDHPYCYRRQL